MTVTTREPVGDKMIKTVVTEEPLCIDFDDIAGYAEPDDCSGVGAPWEDCDGWEHETRKLGYWDHEDVSDSRGYARCGRYDNKLIEIDDDVIIGKWGHTCRNGESKQVWLERVARIKRDALDQLVKWYEDGWYVYAAVAEYGDYTDSLCGIYDDDGYSDYMEDTIMECRREVAARMEDDGFIVENQPDRPKPYSRVKRFRDQIQHNLNPWHK